MRLPTLVLCGLLAACATPKTDRNAYWAGTYAPGQAIINEDGSFRSSARVIGKDDEAAARLAAWSRLKIAAEQGGFGYFTIGGESDTSIIGARYSITGKLLHAPEEGAYRVSAIEQVLNGYDLGQPSGIQIASAAPSRTVKRLRTAAPVPVATDTDEPLVIMAPEDITGSIRPATTSAIAPADPAPGRESQALEAGINARPQTPAETATPIAAAIAGVAGGIDRPAVPEAVSGIPGGVVLRRY